MSSRVVAGANTEIALQQLTPEQVQTGTPQAGIVQLGPDCGLWEHTPGVSTDVEVEEYFVVLAGRARIEIEGQDPLDIGPGDVVHLAAGARTTWHVTETLRKFWFTP
ncbi:MAG: cupin domain-containing protein [Candidatus Nanopelagicales bacterium]